MSQHQSQRKTRSTFSRDKNSEQMLSILSLKFVKFFDFQKMNIVRYFGLFEIHLQEIEKFYKF